MNTVDVLENSNHGGMPIYLFQFKLGTKVWGYTSSAREMVFDGVIHKPVPVSTTTIQQSLDPSQDSVTITIPDSTEVAQLFLGSGPSTTVYAFIKETHLGAGTSITHFQGEVTDRKIPKVGQCSLICNYITVSFDKNGTRMAWSRTCQHALYDGQCRVEKSLFAVQTTIDYLDGVNVGSVAFGAFPTDYFSGGFFEWASQGGVLNTRTIDKHTGSNFLVFGFTDGLGVGMTITTYPGCRRTTDDCLNKFNNMPNYGGYPGIPGKSPFDGDPIF